MRTTRMLVCALLLGAPTSALADDTSPPKASDKDTSNDAKKLSDVDTQAIAHQHAVNMIEIDMGKLAQKNGSQAVKQYGQMLVKDHGTADKQVVAFGKKHDLTTIPADTAMTEADKKDHDMMVSRLKAMKGADFDREFLQMMVTGHDREITKIEADIGVVDNKDLAALLKDIKPVLQKHADKARELQKSTTSMNP